MQTGIGPDRTERVTPVGSPAPDGVWTVAPLARGLRRVGESMVFIFPSLVTFIVLWEGAIHLLEPPPWLIPAPSDVALALYNGFAVDPRSTGGYYVHILTSLEAVLSGWVIGSLLGIVLGIVISQSRFLERLFLPYVSATQTIPKIAIAPMFLVWFGIGITSKIALVITSAFFPNFINSLVAFKTIEQDLLDMMRSFGARRRDMIRRILLPSALPMIFASLELSLFTSFLVTITGEFVGARRGLGLLLLERSHTLDTAGVFALLVVLAFLGTALHSGLLFVRRRVLFWSPAVRGQIHV